MRQREHVDGLDFLVGRVHERLGDFDAGDEPGDLRLHVRVLQRALHDAALLIDDPQGALGDILFQGRRPFRRDPGAVWTSVGPGGAGLGETREHEQTGGSDGSEAAMQADGDGMTRAHDQDLLQDRSGCFSWRQISRRHTPANGFRGGGISSPFAALLCRTLELWHNLASLPPFRHNAEAIGL